MAHDITFKTENPKDKPVYFFGYMEGIFYRAFDCTQFDRGLSGSNEFIKMKREEVFKRLELIKKSDEQKRYPDPNRFPDFYQKIKKTKGKHFIICFS